MSQEQAPKPISSGWWKAVPPQPTPTQPPVLPPVQQVTSRPPLLPPTPTAYAPPPLPTAQPPSLPVFPPTPTAYAQPPVQSAYVPTPTAYAQPPAVYVAPPLYAAPPLPTYAPPPISWAPPLPVPPVTPPVATTPAVAAPATTTPSKSSFRGARSSGTRHRALSVKLEAERSKPGSAKTLGFVGASVFAGLALVVIARQAPEKPETQVADVKPAPVQSDVVKPTEPTKADDQPRSVEGRRERVDSHELWVLPSPSSEAVEQPVATPVIETPQVSQAPREQASPAPRPLSSEPEAPRATDLKVEPRKPEAAPVVEAPKPTPSGPHEVTDQYDSGKVMSRYRVDKDGKKDGSYVSFHENGKVSVRATYKADALVGAYEAFHSNGKPKSKRTYNKKGLLHGRAIEYDETGHVLSDLVFVEGHLGYTKTPEQIAKAMALIEQIKLAPPSGKPSCSEVTVFDADAQIRALRRLLGYRALCDLSTDVTLDFSEAEKAAAGAKLLTITGKMEHTPMKPAGVSDLLYKLGFDGTSHGNLYTGDALGDMPSCVDGWIEDSDHNNAAVVGHRRWCLDPAMKHAAFAKAGQFAVMYAHDGAGRSVPEVADGVVSWPPRGYCPTTHFRQSTPWSVSLDPRHFGRIPSDVKLTMQEADEGFRKGALVEFTDMNVDRTNYSSFDGCVTWKPKTTIAPGARYWVKLEGLKDAQGAPATVEYLVEFYKP